MGDSENINKQNNFQNFIEQQRKIIDSIQREDDNPACTHDKKLAVLSVDELFKFLEEHFSEFHEFSNLNTVVPFLHRCLVHWSENGDFLDNDIGMILFNFLEHHLDDEGDLAIVVQIIHQILYSLKSFEFNKEIKMSKKVFDQLTEILPKIKNRKLISSVITCLQLFMSLHPNYRQEIIRSLWSDLSPRLANPSCIEAINSEVDILMQLFDEFHAIYPSIQDDPIIVATIQKLLLADEKQDRKYGYYLFKKMLQYLVEKFNNFGCIWITAYSCQNFQKLWSSYIQILENLEEEKSQIILSSLTNLSELIQSKLIQNSWLDILYKGILTHKTIEIRYWAMEFFLQTFKMSDLSEDILKQLFKTSNSTWLFNYEGYFLNLELFKTFLTGDLSKFYDALVEIDWEDIPLYVWIKTLYENEKELDVTAISYDQILKISSKVFDLKDWLIREHTVKLANLIFKQVIDKMSMQEYVTYVEALYKTTDEYEDFETLYNKKSSLNEMDAKDFIFKQHFYKIIVKNLENSDTEVNKFITFLIDVPQKHHGWLKLVPYHYYENISDDNIQNLKSLHEIDLDNLKSTQLTEIINKFEQHLIPEPHSSDDEKEILEHCRASAISFYVQQRETLDNEDDETLKIILKQENTRSIKMFTNLWKKLSKCLENTEKTLDTWIIDEYLNRIYRSVARSILEYISKAYDDDTKNKYYEIILEKYPGSFYINFNVYLNPLKFSNQTRFFYGGLKKNEYRIKQIFSLIQFNVCLVLNDYFLNLIWKWGILKYCDEKYVLYLLKCHKELTIKNPEYVENSEEHCIKLRIAIVICDIRNKNIYSNIIFDQIWNILLNEHNQENICYMYEYIIATYESRTNLILDKLKEARNLTPKQQVSIMAVAFIFSMKRDLDNATKEKIISYLLSLIMCTHMETRTFAQISLYKLLNNKQFENILRREQIIESIKIGMGSELSKNLNDIRFYMHEKEISAVISKVIYFVTGAIFDPLCFTLVSYLNPTKFFTDIKANLKTQEQITKCRNYFLINKDASKKSPTCSTNQLEYCKNSQENEIIVSNELILYPKEKKPKSELFIVASLIDNISTLSALANSCHALRLQNMVINSKIQIEQDDVFKNLNESTEKSFNLIEVKCENLKEFLINKQQTEGYKVVAIEETKNRENLTNFKFPQKCILLLGHAKLGIPVTLSGVIDHTLEIVNTPGVQELGFLCMWKYYEQNMKKIKI